MRILHTSDWHLNDRLRGIDRQADIRERLVELGAYLEEHRVDVMLVAGDLFNHQGRMEELQAAFKDLTDVFRPFLQRRGTIIAISGNHDREALFGLLRHAQDLTAPLSPGDDASGPVQPGRLYLAAQPTSLQLAGPQGDRVHFVLLPYPTTHCYEITARCSTLEERNLLLQQALLGKLRALRDPALSQGLPSVLVAHAHVRGSEVHSLYRITEKEDVIFDDGELPVHWAYAAYGHIHKAQALGGLQHVRYSGSIERLDLAERFDDKSAVLVDVGPEGRRGDPVCLPLRATPIYQLEIDDPDTGLAGLAERYPEAARALTYYRVFYKPGRHNREEIRRELERVFPVARSCQREIVPEGGFAVPAELTSGSTGRDVPETVRGYLQKSLAGESGRDEVLRLFEELLVEESAEPAGAGDEVAA